MIFPNAIHIQTKKKKKKKKRETSNCIRVSLNFKMSKWRNDARILRVNLFSCFFFSFRFGSDLLRYNGHKEEDHDECECTPLLHLITKLFPLSNASRGTVLVGPVSLLFIGVFVAWSVMARLESITLLL